MKNIIQFSFLILALAVCFHTEAYGQKNKKSKTDQYFNESGNLKSKLWYGGDFTLGFGSSNYESQFQLGISPMAGYKITNNFSIGPRVSLIYTYYKINLGGGNIQSASPLSWGIGGFTRYKFIPALFAHIEYQYENEAYFILSGDLEVVRQGRDNIFLGGGYTSGQEGGVGVEILLLYNANIPSNSIENPFVLRFGINYNF